MLKLNQNFLLVPAPKKTNEKIFFYRWEAQKIQLSLRRMRLFLISDKTVFRGKNFSL